eukprot:887217-Rhodomonas_salina.2
MRGNGCLRRRISADLRTRTGLCVDLRTHSTRGEQCARAQRSSSRSAMGEGGAEQRQAGGGSAKEHIMRLRLHQRRRKRVSRGRSRGSQHKRVSEGRSARVGSDCARVGAEWSGVEVCDAAGATVIRMLGAMVLCNRGYGATHPRG